MLVSTATSGLRSSNDPSDSSASHTTNSPSPWRALEPRSFSSPPTRKVGSRPASTSTRLIMEVVVVLPWVPQTAIPRPASMSQARACARLTTRIPLRRASWSSTLCEGMAEEMTTTSGWSRLPALWPMLTGTPAFSREFDVPRGLEVGAGDLIAPLVQDQRDAAHARAADADEVEAAQPLGRSADRPDRSAVGSSHGSLSSRARGQQFYYDVGDAGSRVRTGQASAAARMRSFVSGSSMPSTSSASRSGVEFGVGDHVRGALRPRPCARSWSDGRRPLADTAPAGRHPPGQDLGHRTARAADHRVGRRQRQGEVVKKANAWYDGLASGRTPAPRPPA